MNHDMRATIRYPSNRKQGVRIRMARTNIYLKYGKFYLGFTWPLAALIHD
jgi:hypothetical protein